MEERSRRTVSRPFRALALAAALIAAGCTGLHAGPRTLASIGAVVIATGSGVWSAGEVVNPGSTAHILVDAGFASVVAGLVAVVVAGGWMAASVACHGDPDCADEEQCREVPAPPGGIPYKQCVPR
jgi:hypothetical protein